MVINFFQKKITKSNNRQNNEKEKHRCLAGLLLKDCFEKVISYRNKDGQGLKYGKKNYIRKLKPEQNRNFILCCEKKNKDNSSV